MRHRLFTSLCFAMVLACGAGAPLAADLQAGQRVFEARCRTCHGGTADPDVQLGPRLGRLVGNRAASQDSGVHSRALAESAIVWDRAALRRFLSDPQHAVPGTLMNVAVTEPSELEPLLDYLESLR